MIDRCSSHGEASGWVMRFLPMVKPGGTVLDVACGTGRHLFLILASGRHVLGIDRDVKAAATVGHHHPSLELIEADLETGAPPPFAGRRFDAVMVTNYLWRPLLPAIIAAVADDGLLLYETFAEGNAHFGRPSNPAFLLRPGELIDVVHPHLRIIAYEDTRLPNPDRHVQRIAAVGLNRAWPTGT
jgi:SAM-dependent methyltransferase